jgi:hypothetical protein
VEKVCLGILPNIQPATDLLDGLKTSIHTTHWSYCALLERFKLFKKGHDEDAQLWSDHAQNNPADQNLQRLAESGSQGTGYLELLLTEFEGYSLKYQGFTQFVDDVELQLEMLKTGI